MAGSVRRAPSACHLQTFAPALPRHLLEQHPASVTHAVPIGRQEQAGADPQSESLQSTRRSQSSSMLSVHTSSVVGGSPQSAAQVQASSPGSQLPSPHEGGGPQSNSQMKPSSPPRER